MLEPGSPPASWSIDSPRTENRRYALRVSVTWWLLLAMEDAAAKESTDNVMAARAEALMAERPVISTAVHSFFASLLAEQFADITKEDATKLQFAESAKLQACSKVLLQAVSAHQMLPVAAWGLANPQGEEQVRTHSHTAYCRHTAQGAWIPH